MGLMKAGAPRLSPLALGLAMAACGEAAGSAGLARGGAGPTELTLLHTSDLHSRVLPFRQRISAFEAGLGLGSAGALEEVAGFARLDSVLARERRHGATLWLDSGDLLEGTEVFRRYRGTVEVQLASALGLDALALGNHELSLPANELGALLNQASFPLLSANLLPQPGSPLASGLKNGVVLSAAGLRVGVLGVANPTSPPELGAASNPWQLVVGADPALLVQPTISELRGRADLVIALSHLGLDGDRALVRGTSGLDLVLGGHQHIVTREPEWELDCQSNSSGCRPRRVAIVHSGSYGKVVSKVQLELSATSDRRLSVESVRLTQLPLGRRVPEAERMLDYLERLDLPRPAPLGFLPRGLARRAPLGGDTALGDFLTDLLRAALAADVVVLNTSALREDLQVGLLLESDLELSLPFEVDWGVALLSGRRLRQGLERAARRSAAQGCTSSLQVAGLELVIDCTACQRGQAACLRVQRRTPLGLLPLRDEELLAVVLPEYLQRSGADFAESAAAPEGARTTLAAALREQAAAGGASEEEVATCVRELGAISATRCRQAWGAALCPLGEAAARAACQRLPWWRGERDGRIELRP